MPKVLKLSLINGFISSCVNDRKALTIQCWIRAEDETSSVRALELDENFRIFFFEAIQYIRVHDHNEVADLVAMRLDDGVESALDLD